MSTRHNIGITKSLHMEGTPRESAQVTDIAYASRNSCALLESIDLSKNGAIRRSEDNGKT